MQPAIAEKMMDNAQSKARGSSFYLAMRIMPPAQREAMYEIYRFCRAIDDIADEEGEKKEKLLQLQQWRQDIERLYQHDAPAAQQLLAKATATFALRKEDFLAVIDGMEMDVHGPIQAPDFAALNLYCDRVACAVGRLSVRVFGMEERDGLLLAHHLGMALQLTNILRDIDEDAQIDRLYLPRELLAQAGVTGHDPAQVLADPAIVTVCASLADTALGHFRETDAILQRCEHKQVRTPRVMAQAYRAIHSALVDRGFAPPRQPVRLNKAKLGMILVRNVLF